MKTITVSGMILLLLAVISAGAANAEMTISRATFCAEIEELEPVGAAESFTADVGRVYLFAEIKDAEDSTLINHVWYYEGDKVSEIEITVNGPRWRTYSYKTITESMTGKWGAEVTDALGNVLRSLAFEVK